MDHPIAQLDCSLHLQDGQRAFALEAQLQLWAGELLALSGPSGSGKTTILRILAGLEKRAQGRLEFQGELWQDTAKGVFLVPQQRSIGVVFQDYALFPNMRVEQNLRFALAKNEDDSFVAELLEVMDLRELKNAYPRELSGGQQQRVALARALVRRPKLLLLDEPLSALDTTMRDHLQHFIREIHERYRLTTLLISHHPEEIQRLADRVLCLEKGKIVEEYRPAQEEPALILRAIWLGVQDGKMRIRLGENELQSRQNNEEVDHQIGQEVWVKLYTAQCFEIVDPT